MKEQKAVCPRCGFNFTLEDPKMDKVDCPECGFEVVFGEHSFR